MSLWVAAIPIILYFVYRAWKSWTDPATQLGVQAANMNWVTSRYLTLDGIRHHCVKRGVLEAMIDQEKKTVRLLYPDIPDTFKDFVELEQWLGEAKALSQNKSEFMRKMAEREEVWNRFMNEVVTWPTDQAAAAHHVVSTFVEKKAGENLDPYMDKLTTKQVELVSEVVYQVAGVELLPP